MNDFIFSCLKINPQERPNPLKLLDHPFLVSLNDFENSATIKTEFLALKKQNID